MKPNRWHSYFFSEFRFHNISYHITYIISYIIYIISHHIIYHHIIYIISYIIIYIISYIIYIYITSYIIISYIIIYIIPCWRITLGRLIVPAFSRCGKVSRVVETTVELRLSERQSSETSNIRTHIFFVKIFSAFLL